MSEVFGFDCVTPLSQELWDAVARTTGYRPRAVGLYVLGPYAASAQSVQFAHQRGAAVWLIYDMATPVSVRGSLDDGRTEGINAARAASRFGAPPGTLIAADIEAGWEPSPDWIAGFCYGVLRFGYKPAVYGSAKQPAFAAAVTTARQQYLAVQKHLVLWDASWRYTPVDSIPEWSPDGLEGLPASGWQYRGGVALVGSPYTVDLNLWREDAGLWWPEPHTVAPPAQPELPLTVHGISDPVTDQFLFPLTLHGSKSFNTWILHDTGAFCLLLDGKTAAACGAPTGGQPIEIEGVTGSAQAYWSAVDVTIAGRTWYKQPCIVDLSATQSLWGYRFYEDHGYGLAINTARSTLTIWDGRKDALP